MKRGQTRKHTTITPPTQITMYAVEQRTRIIPGQPPMTISREVNLRNGKGRKTVKITRGNRILSEITRKLNLTERRRITRRKYVKGLYKQIEKDTLRHLN